MTEISSTTGKANTLGERFFDQGYLFPVDVFSHDEITGYRNSLEDLEQRLKGLATGNKNQLNYAHLLFRFANEMVREVTGKAMQLMGGYGYSREYPMEQKMRDAWGWGIAGGSIDIQKVNIASSLVGRRFNQRAK